MFLDHNLPFKRGDLIYWDNYRTFGLVDGVIAHNHYKIVDFDQIHLICELLIKGGDGNMYKLSMVDNLCGYKDLKWIASAYAKYPGGIYKARTYDGKDVNVSVKSFVLPSFKVVDDLSINYFPIEYDFEYFVWGKKDEVIYESEIASADLIETF